MWYENIQPLGWWIGKHITDGKKEINFSEFNTYKPKRKAHKFKEIVEMVEEDEMPLPSYLIVHGGARLNDSQKKLLIEWAKNGKEIFDAK